MNKNPNKWAMLSPSAPARKLHGIKPLTIIVAAVLGLALAQRAPCAEMDSAQEWRRAADNINTPTPQGKP